MASLARNRRWEVVPFDAGAAQLIEDSCGVSSLAARIMAGRGICDAQQARDFLSPSLDRDWADPLLIPGLDAVVVRLQHALEAGEHVAVFGDFDVDGISATCLLTSGLRDLGGNVTPFIPKRFGEGYGLSQIAVERLLETCAPDLIVTVDTGIASAKECAELLERGIDVAVTDHHEPGDLVPQGVPVCDPKLDPECPSRELAGVGVALKVIDELGHRMGQPDLWREYTDIATLGTVSDMMLLTGENRSLVAEGIARLRRVENPGLAALAVQARRDLTQMSADDLAFSLIPRMNAAGRMDDPAIALNLLMERDPQEAERIAMRLEDINRERRAIERQLFDDANALVEATYEGGRVIVVGGEGWHEGVKGIVASRIVSLYHVPVILFTISDGVARGSGRSVGDVNLFEAVESCSDLLIRFGGHAGAVGITLDAGNLDAFRDRMEEYLAALPPEDFEDRLSVSAVVDLAEVTVDTISSLSVLQPFGQGNETPVLAVTGATMTDRRRRGEEGKHLSFLANDASGSCQAIMFNAENVEALVECDEAVDIVFEPKVETWQNRVSCKMHVKDVLLRDARDAEAPDPATVHLVEALFENADQYISESELESLANASQFHTKVVGVTFDGRQSIVARLQPGDALRLEREPSNPNDPKAVALIDPNGDRVGYLKRFIAAAIAPRIDRGAAYRAVVENITGGVDGRPVGVNVLVSIETGAACADELEQANARAAERARLAAMSSKDVTDELRRLLIGEHELLPAQARALENLEAGVSSLCVMATGRGKSLIFHVHAARCALLHNKASVFVYPLRALVSDQAYHLGRVFDSLGMTTRVLTGETPLEDRASVFEGLASGAVDIVLTTPEFLAIHSAKFASSGRVGFVVVDEAHHAGLAASGNRSSYLDMPRVLDELGHPCVLAVTATASAKVGQEICRLLDIAPDGVVLDPSVRENLHVSDERGRADRDERLVSLLASGQKTLVYVNSREQTVNLARTLRRRVRDFGYRVAFYNAGLSRSDRAAVEDAFRSGEVRLVVSTSAFGEGVNLPDVRHVVLYHLPFDEVEFNQMSGRAGRDGSDSWIHLAYGGSDARINERVLSSDAPCREDLVSLYRVLCRRDREARLGGEDGFALTNAELAADCASLGCTPTFGAKGVSCGISIFRELGFTQTSGYGVGRRISMVPSPERMDLTRSIRYLEGLNALQEFDAFRRWALESDAPSVLARINRPILPTD